MYRNYCEDTRSAAMGLYLGEKAYWGQGCGSEAIRLLLDYLFREMKLHKVHITVSDFNTRAIRVYAKCGFRRDGVLRHNAIIDGRLVDHLVMSILEEEWGGRTIDIEPFTEQYQAWACEEMTEQWSSPLIVSRGRLHQADTLPGFVALIDGAPQGLLTYRIEEEEECEVVTLHAVIEGIGIGTALLDAARRLAKARGCRRLWLVTANENTPALRFYQKRGFTLVAVYPDAFTEYRKLKPSIPLTGIDGIPIRDEIELEIRFGEKR
jgi:RimJ/RimL family protein N-acetyltransferase